MKIAIPVDEKKMDSSVCVSFGRTPYFLFYDTAKKESEFLDNSAAASSGGAGIKAAQILVDHQVEILLTPRCGENAADVLLAGEIKIFKSQDVSAQENIAAFHDGKLTELKEIHAGFHRRGGN